ncbi:calcium/proton exchanger [Pullulanibacillus sp. KACC 23026]|uniref:calcium/proton exchanger n=1 Tax=Pullulanibacillus sp. KACC 23026 TaxID=3028315 RepID=UPI0023B17DBB|nr:calcium/proton exchanger [Pullulanibacillus sp. KACC 23026]WEG10816.1 calcium/proton exchanger [Pullulanibacillus sp. KACC 23026]
MNTFFRGIALIGVPVSIIGELLHMNEILQFFIYCVTLIGLANEIRRSTESLAFIVGPTLGGLLNATFGNAAEIIISFFALREGLNTVVISSITGVVLVNLLFAGGISILIGGLKFKEQKFSLFKARHNTGILLFALAVSFVLPYIFSFRLNEAKMQVLSTAFSIVMIIIYLLALMFRLVTHKGIFKGVTEFNEEEEEAEWGAGKSLLVLAVATVLLAYISENLVGVIEPIGKAFGWSEVFIGIIVIAIVGSASEYVSAISMALKNKMDLMMEVSIGSTVQTAMFVGPVLVLLSWMFTFLPLVFNLTELITMIVGVFITITIVNDGESNWFEGAVLLATYIAMAFGFYLL